MTGERMKDGWTKRKINYFWNETAAIVSRTQTLFAFGFAQHSTHRIWQIVGIFLTSYTALHMITDTKYFMQQWKFSVLYFGFDLMWFFPLTLFLSEYVTLAIQLKQITHKVLLHRATEHRAREQRWWSRYHVRRKLTLHGVICNEFVNRKKW